MSYPKGRKYEQQLVRHINKKYGTRMKAERVLLSGQRGEGDVVITVPIDQDEGKVVRTEVKARKSVPKVIYEWLGKHDLLVMKRIGRKYGWLVALDLDEFLELLAESNRNPDIAGMLPKNGGIHYDDDDLTVL